MQEGESGETQTCETGSKTPLPGHFCVKIWIERILKCRQVKGLKNKLKKNQSDYDRIRNPIEAFNVVWVAIIGINSKKTIRFRAGKIPSWCLSGCRH